MQLWYLKKFSKSKIFYILIIFISFVSYQGVKLQFKSFNLTNDYVIEVLPKQSFKTVLKQLYQDNLINIIDYYVLNISAKIFKYDRYIKAGEYSIAADSSVIKLIKKLMTAKVLLHKFTIVEGLRFEQIIEAINSHPKIKKTPNLSCENILNQNNCEGLFLADTYLFPKDTTDIEILWHANWVLQQELDKLWGASKIRVRETLKSQYRALILASIIEKEAKFYEEMEEISGVYHRRLEINMLLQADPTVIYGLKSFDRVLTLKDLKQPSIYNTYLNKGLPPGPIAISGVAAIKAALNPREGDSLYFVADGVGKHIFSASLQEHNQAIKTIKDSKK